MVLQDFQGANWPMARVMSKKRRSERIIKRCNFEHLAAGITIYTLNMLFKQ